MIDNRFFRPNGAAFFFGVLWFSYRKMKREAYIILLSGFIINIIGLYIYGPNYSGINFLIFAAAMSLFANNLYYRKIKKVLAEYENRPISYFSENRYIQKNHVGTSWSNVVDMVIVSVFLFIIQWVIIAVYFH